MNGLIVAIDGPSGVGKTSTSKELARKLGVPHIDTGAMYRAIALKAIREEVAFDDSDRLATLASASNIEFLPSPDRPRTMLDGEDVTSTIREPEISMAASRISAVPALRRILVELQQQLGRRSGGVLEGRDIGTKVFPETPHKFFLTSSRANKWRNANEVLMTRAPEVR
jgi:CMP/dCMP kinase